MQRSKSGQKNGQLVKAARTVVVSIDSAAIIGSGDWIRTSDLGVMNPTL